MRILTDCDGVLLNWEYAFNTWMQRHGYGEVQDASKYYDVGDRYGIPTEEKKRLVKFFNESSAIGFLPPLRDAMHYVDKLHRKHGCVFHVITSLSLEPTAQELRIANLNKMFGSTVFEKFVFLDTGADKHEALELYRNSYNVWIEDKVENADLGYDMGLDSIIMEHGFNMDYEGPCHVVRNWKEVYEYVVG